jgi:hypothetical protein
MDVKLERCEVYWRNWQCPVVEITALNQVQQQQQQQQ